MHRFIWVALLPVWLSLLGCHDAGARDRIARLSRRVDSLTVTLTAVTQQLSRSRTGIAPGGDTATVSGSGVASLGRASAPVTLVEFMDYQCPFCGQHFRTVFPRLRGNYIERGKIRYVIRDLPLPMHTHAKTAAVAARCAREQGRSEYWAYHDSLFSHQRERGGAFFRDAADQVGLDTAQFNLCLRNASVLQAVEADVQAAKSAGLTGTPSFVLGRPDSTGRIHGTVIPGAYPYERFQTAIDSVLGRKSQ